MSADQPSVCLQPFMIRKLFFWTHLSMGVAAGLVIALMAATGVLLTYEVQLLALADRQYQISVPPAAGALPLDALIRNAEAEDIAVSRLILQRDSAAPVLVSSGRRDPGVYLDPYTGAVLGPPSAAARELVSSVRGLHRWLLVDGEGRRTARLVTGISNLGFLLLIASGLYLWLPRIWRWVTLKPRLLFSGPYRDGRSRDYHWHHVLGLWCAIPLLIITATALVFSFSWANRAVYAAFGESPPVSAAATEPAAPEGEPVRYPSKPLSELVALALAGFSDWQRAIVHVPAIDAATIKVEVDAGNGRQPQRVTAVHLSRSSGDTVLTERFGDRSPGRQARSWIRFLHTGEALGWVGQTMAGLVSALTLIMVWTGLALAWRRLVRPLLRTRAEVLHRSPDVGS